MKKFTISVVSLILILVFPLLAEAGPFVAFSLKVAQKRLMHGDRVDRELKELGGITDIAGVVYDHKTKDLIIVGQFNERKPKITLDDLVVALRSVFLHKKTPLVSIDPTEETEITGMQKVRYEGGIKNTQIGKDMLEADIILKKLALNKLKADVWGVRSYLSMMTETDQVRKGKEGDRIASRFWFKNFEPSLAARKPPEGVLAIMELDVDVKTEILSAKIQGKPVQDLSGIRDEVGDIFAQQVAMNLSDLSIQYPVLARARPILALVSIAVGIEKYCGEEVEIDFLLNKYKVTHVDDNETPEYYKLIKVEETVEGSDLKLASSGGIELNPIVVKLKKGYISALREAVLSSRPAEDVLIWHPPLEGWRIPGIEDIEADQTITSSAGRKSSFLIDSTLLKKDQISHPTIATLYNNQLPPLRSELPEIKTYDNLPSQGISSDVGGVMLRGVAQISGDTQVDLSGGNFSLVVDGENAYLDPDVFRKFVTALWSVYYSKEDPGISIDPIAPGVEKHLVRYIGKVINNDLGRVMRETDYLMKKWAVGTERPDISGFENPDDIAGRRGVAYVGTWSRFWFVPENMRFKRGGDMLLFEDGRMMVKTEYMFQNKERRADPANEAFAEFFTRKYNEIAEQYPVYQELFEYAKLVSLAKYLKENGVPLYWFLMANRDLVITEDSPGTVEALAKGSDHFEGIYIEGGVNLNTQGQYVYDQEAVQAINKAISQLPSSISQRTTMTSEEEVVQTGAEPFSFDLEQESYTVLPQHSLTSGKDRRGIRYQTDLAFRRNGEPGLELVRYFNPKKRDTGEFGEGWHLLIPYRVKRVDRSTTQFRNAVIQERMAVENLLTGKQEILTFSPDRYSIAGYVPDKLESSQIVGLFIMTDGSSRLVDKLGNEFHFDQAGSLTEMFLSDDVPPIHIDYNYGLIGDFKESPYQILPAGEKRVEFLDLTLPERMKVVNLATGTDETFIFKSKWGIGAYIPENGKESRFKKMVLMIDGTFRLIDSKDNEIAFDPAGNFIGFASSVEDFRVVKSISQGDQKIVFKYDLHQAENVRITTAYLEQPKETTDTTYIVHYQYDDEGRLAKVETSKERLVASHHHSNSEVIIAQK